MVGAVKEPILRAISFELTLVTNRANRDIHVHWGNLPFVFICQVNNNIRFLEEEQWNHVSASIFNGGGIRTSIDEQSRNGARRVFSIRAKFNQSIISGKNSREFSVQPKKNCIKARWCVFCRFHHHGGPDLRLAFWRDLRPGAAEGLHAEESLRALSETIRPQHRGIPPSVRYLWFHFCLCIIVYF